MFLQRYLCCVFVTFALIALGLAHPACGQFTNHVWTGGEGLWSDVSGWDIGVVPSSETARVFIDQGNSTSSTVTINADSQFHSLRLDSDDRLQISGDLDVHSEIYNSGTIDAEAISSITYREGVLLHGGGTLNLNGASVIGVSSTNQQPNITNWDNTIVGHVQGSRSTPVRLTNYGSVNANTAGHELGFVGANHGVARATNGGHLAWHGGVNTGTIIAESGSTVSLGHRHAPRASGGTVVAVDGANPGTIRLTGSIADIDLFGNVEVHGASFYGRIGNYGPWTITGQRLTVSNASLTGGGEIDFDRGEILATARNSTLTNVSSRIHGSGAIWVGQFNNGGILEADDEHDPLVVRVGSDGAGNLTNDGTIKAVNGAHFVLPPNTVSVLMNQGGMIEIGEGSTFESGLPVVGGTIVGPNAGMHGNLIATLSNTTVSGNLEFSGAITDSLAVTDQVTINSSEVAIEGAYVELSGGGELYLNGSTIRHIFLPQQTLVNEDLVIRGSGIVRASQVQNHGVIIAEPTPAGATLTFTKEVLNYPEYFTNDGSIFATGGTTLSLPSIDNRDGAIFAEDGSTVSVRHLVGGTIVSTGAGVISAWSIEDLTNNGTIVSPDDASVFEIGGRIVNNGTIKKHDASLRWAQKGEAGVTFAGGGELSVLGANNWFPSVVNEASHTITGSGQIESNTFINFGSVTNAKGNVPLELRPGRILNYGEISGNVVFSDETNGADDTLTMVNAGNFRPWRPGSFLQVPIGQHTGGSHFENTAEGTLEILIGEEESTAVVVAGTAGLAGSLMLELVDSIAYGQEYMILKTERGGLSGTFERIDGAMVNNTMALATTYHSETVLPFDFVRVTVALPGDANLDGTVDGLDFLIWSGAKFTSGGTWSTGDFNGDSFVDGTDFLLWNANKFSSIPAIVPEPMAIAVWLIVGCLAAGRRCNNSL